jgi:hypothetical protein
VYQSTSPEWVDANYPKRSMYDDAHVNVLEETLPFQSNHRSGGIGRERRNLKRRN